MFWVSVVFLANTAMSIVLWVDVPRVSEAYLRSTVSSSTDGAVNVALPGSVEIDRQANRLRIVTLFFALMLWPIFIAEFLFYYFSSIGPR